MMDREMEHQVFRLLNMSRVVKEISDNDIPGDFIEFGVYQGFSLVLLAKLRDLYGLSDRRIIGIDSFNGLPADGDQWRIGQFSDTGPEVVDQMLQSNLSHAQNQNIIIIKSWFDDVTLPAIESLSLIHMDCDLGVSLTEAFNVVETYLQGTQYLLFDDWGISKEEIPKSFNEWALRHPDITLEMFSETKITRYYKSYTGEIK
jgi:O-methyltransferase